MTYISRSHLISFVGSLDILNHFNLGVLEDLRILLNLINLIISHWGRGFPLKNHWRWEYIHTSKTSNFHVNDNPVTQYGNFRLLKTLAATPLKHII